MLATNDQSAVEVSALEAGKLRSLSAHNRALLDELALGTVEDIASTVAFLCSPGGSFINSASCQLPRIIANQLASDMRAARDLCFQDSGAGLLTPDDPIDMRPKP